MSERAREREGGGRVKTRVDTRPESAGVLEARGGRGGNQNR